MAINYRIYSNGGSGGAVDYSAPVATVAVPTYTPPALAHSSDHTFAVRAFDTVTGFEEKNLTATARVVTGPSGQDRTAVPAAAPPFAVTPTGGTSAVVRFRERPRKASPAPTGYRVYVGTPTVSYAAPAATAAAGPSFFSVPLSGLTPGTTYLAVLRAYNAAGEEANTAAVPFTTPAAAPSAPDYGGVTVGPAARPGVPPVFP